MPPAKAKAIRPTSARNRDLTAARRVLLHASNAIAAIRGIAKDNSNNVYKLTLD